VAEPGEEEERGRARRHGTGERERGGQIPTGRAVDASAPGRAAAAPMAAR
jgi:hypothetical protein